ncbi:MAG: Rieske (2Fe-2S) protein [Kineosporiaceae bacterium]
MTVMSAVDRLATDPRFRALDRAGAPLGDAVRKLPQAALDVLHGTWLGHPLHPAVAMLPVGAFLSSAVIDVATTANAALGGDDARARERRDGADDASALLVAVGLAAVPLAAAAGAADWSQLRGEQKRIGLVHAAANTAATVLLAGSLVQRRRGRRSSGRALGVAGTLVSGAAAAIGGHLSYRWGAGANHADGTAPEVEDRWTSVGRLEDFADRTPVRAEVDGAPVVVVRSGGVVQALGDVCSHLSGPLHEGEVSDETVDGRPTACVSCPWHGSVFSLEDGRVVHGPATSPQPAFETRVLAGEVQVRPLPAGTTTVDLRERNAVGAGASAGQRPLGAVVPPVG